MVVNENQNVIWTRKSGLDMNFFHCQLQCDIRSKPTALIEKGLCIYSTEFLSKEKLENQE